MRKTLVYIVSLFSTARNIIIVIKNIHFVLGQTHIPDIWIFLTQTNASFGKKILVSVNS